MKGGNTDSKAPEVQGFDYDNVEQYGTVNLTGGKGKGKGKSKSKSKSSKFSEFDFEKEWKEFEESYNQKYGGASKRRNPLRRLLLLLRNQLRKRLLRRSPSVKLREVVMKREQLLPLRNSLMPTRR